MCVCVCACAYVSSLPLTLSLTLLRYPPLHLSPSPSPPLRLSPPLQYLVNKDSLLLTLGADDTRSVNAMLKLSGSLLIKGQKVRIEVQVKGK